MVWLLVLLRDVSQAVSGVYVKPLHKITQFNTVTGATDAQGTHKKLDCTTAWRTHTSTLSRSGPRVSTAVHKLSLFQVPITLV